MHLVVFLSGKKITGQKNVTREEKLYREITREREREKEIDKEV